ncbi:MAG TPA: sulfite exporter TauE/SafE family protein [Thermoleophilaceae bacterium]|nr:sulfite exporter TauE/SafE family protein [Thermoleophilaceae bacterium]
MLLAALAAFAGAAVQSASGLGFALVLSPALFAVMEPEEAVTAVLILGIALCALVLIESHRVATHGLARILVPAAPGLALGVLLLSALSKQWLQVGVGVAVIAAAAWQLRHHAPVGIPAVLAGFLSGVLTTSISVNGPPLALWLEGKRVPPPSFRATLAAAFLALDVAGVALILGREGADTVDLGSLGPLLACVLVGYAIGAVGFRRLDAERFSTVVLVVVICTGVASVVAGLV